jgi:hypothetical protein
LVGKAVGDLVGAALGDLVGAALGDWVGPTMGDLVGLVIGDLVGAAIGDLVDRTTASSVTGVVGDGLMIGGDVAVALRKEHVDVDRHPEAAITATVNSSSKAKQPKRQQQVGLFRRSCSFSFVPPTDVPPPNKGPPNNAAVAIVPVESVRATD